MTTEEFIQKVKAVHFWTYDECYAEARKYKTKQDFRKNNIRAYGAACRKGWYKDYTWFEPKFRWTYETCKEVAKQYKTKREFEKGHCGAYIAARKNGWLKDFDWFVSNRINVIDGNFDNVYSYYFEDYNAIYIGRTIRPKRRDREHIFNTKNDIVARFALEHDCPVPPMYIIEENLTLKQGQEREDYWINYYREQGYIILNSARTGIGIGSLGALGSTKWMRGKCYEEAKKYTYRKEFQRGSVGAYTRALRMGWLEEYSWFKRPANWNEVWDYDTCNEEALKYQTIAEFRRCNLNAYTSARKRGWLKEFTWLVDEKRLVQVKQPKKQRPEWNYDTCYAEAKKYKTRSEFEYAKGASGAYVTARRNGWIDDYTWFEQKQKPNGYWTYERCYDEASKYTTRTDFQYGKGSGRAYKVARDNGWLDDYVWLEEKRKPVGYWSYERCVEESRKFHTRAEFKKGCQSAYVIANRNGWLRDFTWLTTKKLWQYEECKEIAAQYHSRSSFKAGNKRAYESSVTHKWIDDFFPKSK